MFSSRSPRTPWFDGPHLLQHLEHIEVDEDRRAAPFRMPVQWVNRPHLDFRGFAGSIASGAVKPGDAVVVASSGRLTKIARSCPPTGDVDEAGAGEAVTLVLADEVDIARGDVITPSRQRPESPIPIHRPCHLMSEEKAASRPVRT